MVKYNLEELRAAIEYTSAETGFLSALIEKDYYCSIILQALFTDLPHQLIFKGGTLLNKVHIGFYRLSEDLDFSISVKSSMSRKEKSNLMKPIKKLLSGLRAKFEGISSISELQGRNNSSQYNALLEYESCLYDVKGTISFEIGLREEILIPPVTLNAHTLVKNPFNDLLLIEPYSIQCLTKTEAYAEKLRAALTRAKPAIRDIFDLDYALRNQVIDFADKQLQNLAKIKLTQPELLKIDLSESKKQILRSQLEAQLRPVLREDDYQQFDFGKAWNDLKQIGEKFTT
jgi:predicted nucleotidyltransferase component of viral defense system